MKMARRQFIKLTTGTGAAFAITARSTTLFAEKSVKPLRILILGGTGFTGPYQVQYALSRGHEVTPANCLAKSSNSSVTAPASSTR